MGTFTLTTDCPSFSARNKVKLYDILETTARCQLCPALPSISGHVENWAIGHPSMLHIEKVHCAKGDRRRRGTLPGCSSIVRRVDDRSNASARDAIRKTDGKNSLCG